MCLKKPKCVRENLYHVIGTTLSENLLQERIEKKFKMNLSYRIKRNCDSS